MAGLGSCVDPRQQTSFSFLNLLPPAPQSYAHNAMLSNVIKRHAIDLGPGLLMFSGQGVVVRWWKAWFQRRSFSNWAKVALRSMAANSTLAIDAKSSIVSRSRSRLRQV